METDSSTFEANLGALPKILEWVRGKMHQTGLDPSEQKKVEVALEEAIVNVIHHNPPENSTQLILHCRHVPNRQIEFELWDKGIPFNPLEIPEKKEKEFSIEEIEVGGLGIPFMRKCMDALFYRREDNQNVLTLVKNTRLEKET